MFATILTAGPMPRTEVARRLGISPSTVTKVVHPLLDAGYLREARQAAAGPGRPTHLLSINRDRHVAVGMKVAPSRITGVLIDLAGQVLARAERSVSQRGTPRTVLRRAAELAESLLDAVTDSRARVLGIGLGLPGHIDQRRGICRYSALLGWSDVDLAGPLAVAGGLPVVANNDVNTLVVGERLFGVGRDADSFAVVTHGVGIGCGLVLNRRLYTGSRGMAGEFGHLPLVPDGPQCTCGSRGCLEAVASVPAILREIRECGGPDCDEATAVEMARADPGPDGELARSAFTAAGAMLGRGVAALCNLLDLDKVILSGEGMVTADLIGPALSDALHRHAFSSAARDCELVIDPTRDDSWARGAACLVIDEAVRR